jgi:hypothetical protein
VGILMRILLALIATAVLCASSSAIGDKPRTLVVIVAKGSKVTGLSRAELRRAFSGDAVVVSGDRLVPFNFSPGSPERIAFDRSILGLSPEDVGRFWVDRKIRGESQPPRALANASLVVRIVARFPGAIGYVPTDQVTDDVVAVAVDGVPPSSPDYPTTIK